VFTVSQRTAAARSTVSGCGTAVLEEAEVVEHVAQPCLLGDARLPRREKLAPLLRGASRNRSERLQHRRVNRRRDAVAAAKPAVALRQGEGHERTDEEAGNAAQRNEHRLVQT